MLASHTSLSKRLADLGTTEVLRVYLAPEDTAVRARRLKGGGNTKRSFTEGWVEFADKRRAKRIASSLNNTPMGGGHKTKVVIPPGKTAGDVMALRARGVH